MAAGVGHGGCAAVAAMARIWPKGTRVAYIDTDGRSLDAAGADGLQIGERVIQGMGTGGEQRMGQRAAESDAERIRGLFRGIDLLFLAVGLGGGAGTGAAPVVAREARNAGAFVVALASLPFRFEGLRRMEIASCGLRALQASADAAVVLPNQRLLRQAAERTHIPAVFRAADEALAEGVQALWRVVTKPGVIPLGLEEIRALARRGQGRCILACAEGRGPDKVAQALAALKGHALLEDGAVLETADAYLVSVMGGADLALQDVVRLMDGLRRLGREDALVASGLCCRDDWQDRLCVALLVAEKAEAEAANPEPGPAEPERPAAERPKPAPPAGPKITQTGLFDTVRQGPFTDVEPTVVDGTNLDMPTYLRRGILIQKTQRESPA